ncbi:MAG: hypothetical protein ACFFD5_04640 [Candidatus Thorarchaeota archaeon]
MAEIFIFLLLNSAFFLFTIPIVKANSTIPSNFNKQLNLETVYIYNVSLFNVSKPLEWADVDWMKPTKGFANTTLGGQIKVNFTGFYPKDPNDFFNLFESPMPYMNIEFIENRSGSLVTNSTFYNVSNGEADMNLLLGYNYFKSGFLIPINNFTYLREQAYAQDQAPMNATVSVWQTNDKITFDFKQEVFLHQNTTSIYDKISGLLIYTNTSAGNYTLEMTLTNLPDLTGNPLIQSYSIIVIVSIIFIIIPFLSLKINFKLKEKMK